MPSSPSSPRDYVLAVPAEVWGWFLIVLTFDMLQVSELLPPEDAKMQLLPQDGQIPLGHTGLVALT